MPVSFFFLHLDCSYQESGMGYSPKNPLDMEYTKKLTTKVGPNQRKTKTVSRQQPENWNVAKFNLRNDVELIELNQQKGVKPEKKNIWKV